MLKKIFQKNTRNRFNSPPKINIAAIRKMKPNCSRKAMVSTFIEKTLYKILDPSRGGIGIRLKKARRTFQMIIIIIRTKNIAPKESCKY
jgi:hypothetical protein